MLIVGRRRRVLLLQVRCRGPVDHRQGRPSAWASSSSSTNWAISWSPSGATSTSRPSASASARPARLQLQVGRDHLHDRRCSRWAATCRWSARGRRRASDGSEDDPRSFKNKTVWPAHGDHLRRRVHERDPGRSSASSSSSRAHGKERMAGVVGMVDAGSPAWQKGLPQRRRPRADRRRRRNPYFDDLLVTVMRLAYGEKLSRSTAARDASRRASRLSRGSAARTSGRCRPVIGVVAGAAAAASRRQGDSPPGVPQHPRGRRRPAFAFDDQIVATTDPDQAGPYDPKKIKELPLDPRE